MTFLSQTVFKKPPSSNQQKVLVIFCNFFLFIDFWLVGFYHTAFFCPKTIKIVDLCEARSDLST